MHRAARESCDLSTAEAAALWGALAPAIQAGNPSYSEIAAATAFDQVHAALQSFVATRRFASCATAS